MGEGVVCDYHISPTEKDPLMGLFLMRYLFFDNIALDVVFLDFLDFFDFFFDNFLV